jgi:acetyltransferase-like isoleucine patch superfamily enzyme
VGVCILSAKIIERYSVISLKSVVTKNTEAWCIYRGNLANKIRERSINKLNYTSYYK